MARNVDTSKIESIKKATVHVVVAEGIKNASVSKIAKEAKVSMGYLYRFYESKDELIQSIFKDLFQHKIERLHALLTSEKTLESVLYTFISELFSESETRPNNALFMLKLMTDYSFKMNEKDKETMTQMVDQMLEMGHKTKEIQPDIDAELLYTLLMGATYFMMNIRKREIFAKGFLTSKDAKKITELYIKALA